MVPCLRLQLGAGVAVQMVRPLPLDARPRELADNRSEHPLVVAVVVRLNLLQVPPVPAKVPTKGLPGQGQLRHLALL